MTCVKTLSIALSAQKVPVLSTHALPGGSVDVLFLVFWSVFIFNLAKTDSPVSDCALGRRRACYGQDMDI